MSTSTMVGPEYPKKPEGWFSRRHPDSEQHIAANAGRKRKVVKARKRADAEQRNKAAVVGLYPCGHKHGVDSPGRCK